MAATQNLDQAIEKAIRNLPVPETVMTNSEDVSVMLKLMAARRMLAENLALEADIIQRQMSKTAAERAQFMAYILRPQLSLLRAVNNLKETYMNADGTALNEVAADVLDKSKNMCLMRLNNFMQYLETDMTPSIKVFLESRPSEMFGGGDDSGSESDKYECSDGSKPKRKEKKESKEKKEPEEEKKDESSSSEEEAQEGGKKKHKKKKVTKRRRRSNGKKKISNSLTKSSGLYRV